MRCRETAAPPAAMAYTWAEAVARRAVREGNDREDETHADA